MQEITKTKEQLMSELTAAREDVARIRQRLAELEAQSNTVEQMKEALQESDARLASIVNINNEAVISIDESQHIVFFNQGAVRIFGYSPYEAIGEPLNMLLPGRLAELHRKHVEDFATSDAGAKLMGERQDIVGCRKNGEEFPAEASISKLEISGRRVFTVVLRDISERKQAEREREDRILQLQALNDAVRAISAELSRGQVLQKITEVARVLVKAKYAALGVHDGQGSISQFITAGIEPAVREKIGPLPVGRGVLGHLMHKGESLIVNSIINHPDSVGFPEHHPIMNNLLGVPIFSKDDLIGALYLTDKEDGSNFTKTDQQLVEMLALHAAIAIENARLYGQNQRLAILEERERFARDLHDGIIQSIYAVGLTLDQVKLDMPLTNEMVTEQIDLSMKSLANVIQDLRNYIFDLRPQALRYEGLKTRLEGLIKELRVNTLLPIQIEISPDIDDFLSDMQARHVFHICHEALANAARHAKAKHISVGVVREERTITLWVKDDGVGFDGKPQVRPGHRGLANMYARASEIGAKLNIDTAPDEGTRLTMAFRSSVPPE